MYYRICQNESKLFYLRDWNQLICCIFAWGKKKKKQPLHNYRSIVCPLFGQHHFTHPLYVAVEAEDVEDLISVDL